MKYKLIKTNNYHTPFTVLKNNEKVVVLTDFISYTLPSFPEEIKECFDKVLKGKQKEIEQSFNDKTIIINKEITKMIDDWHDNAEYYTINTKDLYQLILKYIKIRNIEKTTNKIKTNKILTLKVCLIFLLIILSVIGYIYLKNNVLTGFFSAAIVFI